MGGVRNRSNLYLHSVLIHTIYNLSIKIAYRRERMKSKIELPKKWWEKYTYYNDGLEYMTVEAVEKAKIQWIITVLELIVERLNEDV